MSQMDSSGNPLDDDIHNTNEEDNRAKETPRASNSKPKKQIQERSWVWEHYRRLTTDTNRCSCVYCGKGLACPTSSGTSNLINHLKICKKYNEFKVSQNQTQLDVQEDSGVKFGRVSEAVVIDATNELMVLAELPLSFVDSLGWGRFCTRVKLYTPHSRRTATRDIVQMYVGKKEEMRRLIGNQRVSLTTDIWVALTTAASYMVITAHWIDSLWRLRKLIIGFKSVTDHKGKTISKVLIDCLAEWGIKKIFTITVDNATANTSALRRFKEAYRNVGNDSLVLDGEFMHVRCAAHIINLVVKDGLKDVSLSTEAIRNAITYVRSSTERLKSFDLRVETGKMTRGSLPLDVKTRWNSTYLMLTRGLKFRLAFDKMEAEDKLYNEWFNEKVDKEKRIGPPLKDDWDGINRLVNIFDMFYHSTLVVSASQSVNAYKCYGEIVTIERELVELSHDPDKDMRVKAADMLAKFDKYWEGMKEINKLLIVATVLNPAYKMEFASLCFEQLYGMGTKEAEPLERSVKQVLTRLFEAYSDVFKPKVAVTRSTDSTQSGVVDVDDCSSTRGYKRVERVELAFKNRVKEKGLHKTSNELELYLKEIVENPDVILGTEYDVMSWWRLNAPKFPVLSELAKDVLSMQVSSVASESAFSTSNRVLEPSRSCLTHYTIEVLMCTEQWLKQSLQLREKGGEMTTQQILSEIALQDQLEREFNMGYIED